MNPPYVTDYYVRMTALLQARLAESDKAGMHASSVILTGFLCRARTLRPTTRGEGSLRFAAFSVTVLLQLGSVCPSVWHLRWHGHISSPSGLALSFTVVVGANEEVRQQVVLTWA